MSVCSCLWCTRFSRLQRHRLYGKYWMNTIVPLRLFHSATNFVMNDFIFLWFEDRFALVRLNVEQVSECVCLCVHLPIYRSFFSFILNYCCWLNVIVSFFLSSTVKCSAATKKATLSFFPSELENWESRVYF